MTIEGAPDRAPAIHIRGARLAYGGRTVFDDLSLDLPAGRTTCLLGPSGVGKTSLLRLIAGLAPAGTRGTVESGDGASLEGRIAWMAQTDLLLPWLSVVENAVLGFRLRGDTPALAHARRRATDILADLGLGDRIGDRPATLSGGMRQRVALARTLVEQRPVVLMDEPFAQLDAITRLSLQDLSATWLRGRTVLLVTHDPLEAARLGHLVHVMTGSPATPGDAIVPDDVPPRPPAAPATLAIQATLLRRLADAHAGDRA